MNDCSHDWRLDIGICAWELGGHRFDHRAKRQSVTIFMILRHATNNGFGRIV
jgi:hypothetical protein